jgi:integrase/recombinase XerD
MTQSAKHAAMSYLIDEYEEHLTPVCSKDTVYRRIGLLKRLHDYLPAGLAYAKTAHLEGFLAQLRRKGRGRATMATYDAHIRGFFAWADAQGKLDGDPTLLMRRPKFPRFQPKPATHEEVEAALATPEPFMTMFALAYYAGLRACEVAACCREYITEEVMFIPRGKGDRRAALPTHPGLWTLVRDRRPGRLFPIGERGGEVNGHWVSQMARRQFARMGMPTMTIHRLRHSTATHLIQAGADAVTVQQIMRHASLATTQVYVETTSERKRAAIALLGAPASL